MTSLATYLRNAVLGVLLDHSENRTLTDEDYAFLNVCSTYGQSREGGGSIRDDLDKLMADRRERQRSSMDLARSAAPDPRNGPGRGDDGPTGAELLPTMPPAATLGTTAPAGADAIPDDTEQAEELPLGTADRGPEPTGELLSTALPPGQLVNQEEQPPDYTRLSPTKG